LEFATGVSVAAKLIEDPAFADAGPVRLRENELVTVIVPDARFDGSATLVAVSEIFGGAVKICGAV
jgi:hypothetical protein